MNGSPEPTPLQRKIAASGLRAEPGAVTAGAAFERALAVAAERLAQVPVRMLSLTEVERTGQEIVDTLPEQPLITLTEGPDGAAGLVIAEGNAVGCLVELLTTGRLADRAPPPRRPTRTDAALVAEFLDTALAEVGSVLAQAPAVVWAAGFLTAGYLPDARPLGLMLDEPGYRLVRCRFALGSPPASGGDGRTGDLIFAFPAAGRGRAPAPPQEAVSGLGQVQGQGEPAEGLWQEGLDRAVAGAQVRLDAILARVRLPLSSVLSLAPGMLVPLPRTTVQSVQLEGADRSLICFARLGQGNGYRALKLDLAEADEELPLPLPAIDGEVVEAHPAPALMPLPEIPDVVARAAAAEARAHEEAADRVMERALSRPAEAG